MWFLIYMNGHTETDILCNRSEVNVLNKKLGIKNFLLSNEVLVSTQESAVLFIAVK